MLIKPGKPASGLAIRNAFQYAAIGILGDARYSSSHEVRRGVCRDFSQNSDSPTLTNSYGDSVRISNAKGKTVRISLVPVKDEQLYEEFAILAEEVERGAAFDELADFKNELAEFDHQINKRLQLWTGHENGAA